MTNTHWQKKDIDYKGPAYVSKYVEYKKVCSGGNSHGLITVSKEFIGKKFKVILIPEVEDDRKESVQSESVLPPQN